jgi:hypothetical protein
VPDNETIAADMDAQYGHRSGRYTLRRRKRPDRPSMCEEETQFFLKGDEIVLGPQDYSHLHTTLEHIVMTQHSVRKGLKIFGKDGENAIISEMQQLHDMDCIEPKQAQMLTREEKQAALNYRMFLKKKRCGRIKGRGYVDIFSKHKGTRYRSPLFTKIMRARNCSRKMEDIPVVRGLVTLIFGISLWQTGWYLGRLASSVFRRTRC